MKSLKFFAASLFLNALFVPSVEAQITIGPTLGVLVSHRSYSEPPTIPGISMFSTIGEHFLLSMQYEYMQESKKFDSAGVPDVDIEQYLYNRRSHLIHIGAYYKIPGDAR